MKIIIAFLLVLVIAAGCSKEPKVVTLENGLQYYDDTTGTGKEAKKDDLILFHFNGWFTSDSVGLWDDWSADTTKIFQSIGDSRNFNPVRLVLGEATFIKGIDSGIEGMKEGGTRTIIIPSEAAYADMGFGPVPPNADIKVVISLLEVKESVKVEMWEADPGKYITTKSGLKYVIIEEGNGMKPDSGDIVSVHYSGWLSDGTKFESSVERDEPFEFQYKVQPLIAGWMEGLQLMKEGTKIQLIIPPDIGYGDRAAGKIPPNSTLIFDVEMLKVEKL